MYLQHECNAKANWTDFVLTVKIHHSEKNEGKTMFSLCVNVSLCRSNFFSLVSSFVE